jgi:MFS family permease
MAQAAATVETQIPARMDRLPWSGWHWYVVLALGTVWILDGLEVTIVGAIGGVLEQKETLGLSAAQIGLAGSVYVAGAVAGALFFGYLTDRLGRKRLFMVTLLVYLVAVVLTAFSWNFLSFAAFRFLTGFGIGGEYAAINSAIDELMPARVRGWVALAINGSFWVGAAIGAALSIVLLNPDVLPTDTGWRVAFGIGATLAVGILLVRRFVPESPRWLMTHGRADEAEKVVAEIEERVARGTGEKLEEPEGSIEIVQRDAIGFGRIAKAMFTEYPRRFALGFSLMASQAFLYNAIFFTYALVLTNFYDVAPSSVPYFLLPFAAGNFFGPLLLGRLFDVVGRRPMIAGCYIVSAVMLAVTGYLFQQELLTATTQTIAWSVIFFVASAAASAGYLTVSEIFPLEIRAMAIAFFYAVATGLGGFIGPWLFGGLIGTGDRTNLMIGYLVGAGLMFVAGVVAIWLGVKAERRSLEDVATPLTAQEGEDAGEDARQRPASAPRYEGPVPAQARWRRPSRSPAYPLFTGVGEWEDTLVDREVERLVQALAENGPARHEELARRVGARFWGPGRFRRALRVGQSEGRIRRTGRDRYDVPEVRVPELGRPQARLRHEPRSAGARDDGSA